MNGSGTLFESKLKEMERDYQELLDGVKACESGSGKLVKDRLQKAKEEYLKNDEELKRSVENGRSKAVTSMARAQLEYSKAVERLLQENLMGYVHSDNSTIDQDRAEAAALYAEYAIDFALQAVRYAYIASLSAVDMQLSQNEDQQ